jgi:heme/copper-type cytochrome/quinol oxidase subunit 4
MCSETPYAYIVPYLLCRREVTAISKDKESENFSITAKHWEPESYVEYVNKQQKNKANENVLGKFFTSFSMAIAMTMVLTRVVLKESQILAMYPGLQDMLSHQRPWDVVISITLVVILTTAIMLLSSDSSSSTSSGSGGEPAAPVGEGGKLVSVDEMKVGGSGSSTVMGGKTVAVEEIKCRYVVNAAGCNSDKISKMIGDDSFEIKPRLGNYILLNRNQVRSP